MINPWARTAEELQEEQASEANTRPTKTGQPCLMWALIEALDLYRPEFIHRVYIQQLHFPELNMAYKTWPWRTTTASNIHTDCNNYIFTALSHSINEL